MIAIADTSFIVASLNTNDEGFAACSKLYQNYDDVIILPQTSMAEITYMLRREIGLSGEIGFLRQLPKSKYRVIVTEPEDFLRTAELLNQYANLSLDFVDATIIAIAERMNIQRVLTLDHRDFSIVRPRHRTHFDLLPTQ